MSIDIETRKVPAVRWKRRWSDPWIPLIRGSFAVDRVQDGGVGAIGKADLVVFDAAAVNREAGAPATPALPNDAFVQIGAENLDAPGDAEGRIDWLWVGVVASQDLVHEGVERQGSELSWLLVRTYRLEGLATLLARVVAQRGQVLVSGSTRLEVMQCPAGNDRRDGIDLGNRSATEPYVHDLSRSSTVAYWTARQYLERILADHLNATRFPDWPTFRLTGQVACLNYVDEFRAAGRPIIELLNDFAGLARGMCWTLETTGSGQVDLRITSAAPAPLTVLLPSGTRIDHPASDRMTDLQVDDSHTTVRVALVERPRRWLVMGQVRTTLTLRYQDTVTGATTNGLIRGWDPAHGVQAGSTDGRYGYVYRFFRLNPAWDGAGCATGLARKDQGFSGDRTYAAATFPSDLCRLDGDLVYPEVAGSSADPQRLEQWIASSDQTVRQDVPRDQVRIYVGATDNGAQTEISNRFSVRIVQRDPAPGILIGSNATDAQALRTLLAGKQLQVTITVHEPIPLAVSREPSGAATDVVVASEAVLHQVAPNTILRLNGVAPVRASQRRTVRDDRPRLVSVLEALGPYLDRSGTATIHNGLHIRPLSYLIRPGSRVRNLDDGRGPNHYLALDSIVTGRTWTFNGSGYGTTYELAPLTLDLGSYL